MRRSGSNFKLPKGKIRSNRKIKNSKKTNDQLSKDILFDMLSRIKHEDYETDGEDHEELEQIIEELHTFNTDEIIILLKLLEEDQMETIVKHLSDQITEQIIHSLEDHEDGESEHIYNMLMKRKKQKYMKGRMNIKKSFLLKKDAFV